MSKVRYQYKTIKTKHGNLHRYRLWFENIKDEDTGELIQVARMRLIKVNGRRVVWYPSGTLSAENVIPLSERI